MTRTACQSDGDRQFGADRHPPPRTRGAGVPKRHQLASSRLLSASTRVEIGIVALGLAGDVGLQQADALLEMLRVETVPLSADHARLAVDAFRHFGKGRHPAGLNIGDSFSYALSQATGEPLLFKGDDFSQTDVKPAV